MASRNAGFFYGGKMAVDTFTWRTQAQPTGAENMSVIAVQFGDGYKQVASSGLNATAQSWTLSLTDTKSNVAPIRSFLQKHVITSFFWVNPWGEKKLYRVKADSISSTFLTAEVITLSFTFEEAFAP